MKVHPVADRLPEMPIDEFEGLVSDIRRNGLREPVVVDHRGWLLDGRHRLRACERLGIEPQRRVFEERDEMAIVAFILSANCYRRHLSVSERFEILRECDPSRDNAQLAKLLGTSAAAVRAMRSRAHKRAAAREAAAASGESEASGTDADDVNAAASDGQREEPPPQSLLDGRGHPVPKDLWLVFSRADVLRGLAKDLRRIRLDAEQAVATLPAAAAMPGPEIDAALRQVEHWVRESIPYCVINKQIANHWPDMARRGWLSVGQWRRLPKELRDE